MDFGYLHAVLNHNTMCWIFFAGGWIPSRPHRVREPVPRAERGLCSWVLSERDLLGHLQTCKRLSSRHSELFDFKSDKQDDVLCTTKQKLFLKLFSCVLTNSNVFQPNEDRNILEEAQGYEPKGTFIPSVSKVCLQYSTFSVDSIQYPDRISCVASSVLSIWHSLYAVSCQKIEFYVRFNKR